MFRTALFEILIYSIILLNFKNIIYVHIGGTVAPTNLKMRIYEIKFKMQYTPDAACPTHNAVAPFTFALP